MKRLILIFLILLCHAGVWAETRYISVPVAEIHKDPVAGSEQVTQGLLWEKVDVVSEKGGWSKVYMTEQYRTMKGYPGWIRTSDLRASNRPSKLLMVTSAKTALHKSAESKSPVVQTVFLGSKIPSVGEAVGDFLPVVLPGGSEKSPLFINSKDVQMVTQIARPSEGQSLVETALQLQGVPYLWGGMSQKGIDCSGLTWTTYRRHGYSIPRDADQQFEFGVEADPANLVAGDLLFFGKAKDYITHVGMYIGDGKFVHASSSLGGVTVSEFALPRFQQNFQGARHILK